MRWLIPLVLVPVAYVLVSATPLGANLSWLLAAPAFALHWVAYVIATAKRLDAAVQAAAWRQVGFLCAVLAVLLFCLWSPSRIIGPLDFAGDALHLAVMEASYNDQISLLPPSERDMAVFYLGGSKFTSIVLAYDQSDEVMLPPGQRSPSWFDKAKGTNLSCEPDALPLWGHWYTVVTQC